MKPTGPESGGRWRCRQEEFWERLRSRAGGGRPGGEWIRGADRGVATVWVAVTTVALCAVFALVLELGQAVTARHRAGGAADLAALAAADRALEGPEAACEAARRVALAQKAVLVRCTVHGEIADVVARSSLGRYAPAVRARAAPPAAPRAVAGRSPFASATSHRTASAGSNVRVGRCEHDLQAPRAPPGQAPRRRELEAEEGEDARHERAVHRRLVPGRPGGEPSVQQQDRCVEEPVRHDDPPARERLQEAAGRGQGHDGDDREDQLPGVRRSQGTPVVVPVGEGRQGEFDAQPEQSGHTGHGQRVEGGAAPCHSHAHPFRAGLRVVSCSRFIVPP